MKKILHIFIFAIILTALLCVSVSAASNQKWKDESGRIWIFSTGTEKVGEETINVATITGAELKTSEGEVRTSELNIPSKVYTKIVNDKNEAEEIEYIVTKIGNRAFQCLTDGKGEDDFAGNTASGDAFLAKKYFGHVTIPDTVKEIGVRAFEYSAIYGTVVIPDSVTTIGERAFAGCVGLDTVICHSQNIKEGIPNKCFYGCKALVEFKSFGKITTYGQSAFESCEALLYFNHAYHAPALDENSNPVMEEKVESLFKYATSIGKSAFAYTSISGELDLSSLESLGESAFYNCTFLTKVTLGKADFVRNAFGFKEGLVSSIKDFVILSEESNYCSENGIVFDKNKTTIYYYSPAKYEKEYVIPDSVTTIEDSAFWGCKATKIIFRTYEIKINETEAQTIEVKNNAFRYSAIETMYFPSTVSKVGENVITNCPNLLWVVFDTGVGDVKTNSVSVGTCPKMKMRAIVKNGKVTIGSGTAYIEKQDCITGYLFDSHFYGYLDTIPDDCTANRTYKCCLCDTPAEVKAPGHSGKILSVSTLTCTTDESYTVDCVACGQIQTIIITAHTGHTFSEPITKTGDKCTYTYKSCSTCKKVVIDSFVTTPYTSGDINNDGAVDATDVSLLTKLLAGYAVNTNWYSCDINADAKVTSADLILLKKFVESATPTIVPNNNTCSRHAHVNAITLQKESCVDSGCYVYFCTDCGDSILIDNASCEDCAEGILHQHIDFKGHFFTEKTIVAATCTSAGEVERTCSVCNHTEKAPSDPIPHQFSWWMLSDEEVDFQYGYCATCKVLGYEEVNRGALDDIVDSIPVNYELYCTATSRSALRPIVNNAKRALTQEQIDQCIQELRRVLPDIQYQVTDIPVVYLDPRGNLSKDTYRSANIIVAYKDDAGNLKHIADPNAEMRIRGNATAGVTQKQPYNIKFSKDVNLLNMGYGKKYCLLANALDTSTIRNAVALEFAQSLGLEYTSQYRFVEVYLDGDYKGCYTILTPIEIGEDRVDIDEEKDVIIHLSYSNGAEDAAFPSPIFGMRLMRLEKPSEYTPYTKSQMIRIMHQVDFAILSGDTDEMAKYMDMDSMLKYFVFHEYVKDMDMIWDSTRFYVEDGLLHGGPIWDLDISQGNVGDHRGKTKSSVTNDEHSGWHYWNQVEVYGDCLTQAQLDALGELSSAIGPWADAYWVNGYNRTTNTCCNTCNRGQRRWWYSYMIEYSEEFRVDVAEFIRDNDSKFKAIYQPITDPTTGDVSDCVIDRLAISGDAAEAINRNYTDPNAPFGAGHHPNSLTYTADNTLSEAVDYLRAWWKTRSEWLYKYYTESYLTEANN
ncbi:MAG: leucine-rich repeat protein [Clostridia bacterium]|nr:leucine-rich repeat protein [Clostridia bacterium]